MSATQVAVLEPLRGRARTPSAARHHSEWASLGAYLGLAVFGALRWGSVLSPAPAARLLALAGLGIASAAALTLLRGRRRRFGAAVAVVCTVAILPVAGVPLTWLAGLRLALIARFIGHGIGTLSQALVPVLGAHGPVPVVILLGAGLLLASGAVMVGVGAGRARGQLWRAAGAIPMLTLIAVPATIIQPGLPYLEGLLAFALVGALVWGERLASGPALLLCAAAASGALLLAPGIRPGQPWIDVGTLGPGTAAGGIERFNFAQGFGALNWPRSGREVFDVRARRPDYWKVEDLDLFDGRGFVPGLAPAGRLPDPARSAQTRFTQLITVTVRGLRSSQVIAAGYADAIWRLGGALESGLDPGTFTVNPPLSPGQSYDAPVYSPAPSAAELARAGRDPPLDGLAPYRSMLVPNPVGSEVIDFAPFPGAAAAALKRSPYARVDALARRLAATSPTPFAYVERVLALLSHGFIYEEHPRPAQFPLVDFLLSTHRGYCQQFAGAMALLLRMGGVPARVAGGFTTGIYDSASGKWIVADTDAHDWVEAWFPHWGWVRFDPTPAVAPARAETVAPVAAGGDRDHRPAGARRPAPPRRPGLGAPARRPARERRPGFGGSRAGGGGCRARRPRPARRRGGGRLRRRRPVARTPVERRIAELERALAISGRPAGPGVTLVTLEHQFAASGPAAGYIRALRLARYAGAPASFDPAGRRALRGELGRGLGLLGHLRAGLALPPQPRLRRSYTGG